VKVSLNGLLASALATSAWSQTANTPLPRFEDHPVKQIYEGTPAAPKIVTPAEREYRTRITQGVEKGWGVLRDGKEQNHPGPNFAGKMIVVKWGCGSPCLMMAMVDAETGDVYSLPLAMNDRSGLPTLALPWLRIGNSVGGNPEVTFRLESRLMVIRATPDYFKENHHSYAHYFLWQNNEWHLIRRVRLQDDAL
jgi:hypothetical protein